MPHMMNPVPFFAGEDGDHMSLDFMKRWGGDQKDFVKYYNKEWHKKVPRWVKGYRKFRHSNQETNGAIERWHATLKLFLRKDKPYKIGRKVVWLVCQLVSDVENYFWTMDNLKWQGAVRNKKIEDIVWAAIHKARTIPDADVRFEEDGDIARVRSQTPPHEEWHALENYMQEECVCSCGQGLQGNTCKHQVILTNSKYLLHTGCQSSLEHCLAYSF